MGRPSDSRTQGLLKSDPATVKSEFRRLNLQLTFHPTEAEPRAHYVVKGQCDLGALAFFYLRSRRTGAVVEPMREHFTAASRRMIVRRSVSMSLGEGRPFAFHACSFIRLRSPLAHRELRRDVRSGLAAEEDNHSDISPYCRITVYGQWLSPKHRNIPRIVDGDEEKANMIRAWVVHGQLYGPSGVRHSVDV